MHGWTKQSPVGQDSSIRRYFRVQKGRQNAILMETVPDGSAHATPGHSLGDFIRIQAWLEEIGLKPPAIYEADLEQGYLLLEDFGDLCFRETMKISGRAKAMYVLAARVLEHLSQTQCPLELPKYYDSHVHKRHRRVLDWYMPAARGVKNEDGLLEAYKSVWDEIESSLPPCPQGFLHIDFHAENLMWLPDESGLKRCGILDFQGAMHGPKPYDLANLLEDARSDVPADLRMRILKRFDVETRCWYRVLATQFHCRVIGQFIKQACIDGNTSYLPHIPRLENYMRDALQDPLLKPLKQFFDDCGVDFSPLGDFNATDIRAIVARDAH